MFSDWFIGTNDVPFTAVSYQRSQQHSHVAIAPMVWGFFVDVIFGFCTLGCTLNNSQKWQLFKLKESILFLPLAEVRMCQMCE